MAVVDGGDLPDAEAFGDSDHGGVRRSKGKSAYISTRSAIVVTGLQIHHSEGAAHNRPQEPGLDLGAGRPRQQVADLRNTGAGTRIGRAARCSPVNRSVQARLCSSSRSAAATSGPVSQTITQERPKPSASRSSWLLPRSRRPLANDPNHAGGDSPIGCGRRCRRASARTAGTPSSGNSSARRFSSSRSALTPLRVLAGPWVGLVPGPVESLAESARPSVQGPECAQKRQVVPRPRHPCPPTRQWTHLSP